MGRKNEHENSLGQDIYDANISNLGELIEQAHALELEAASTISSIDPSNKQEAAQKLTHASDLVDKIAALHQAACDAINSYLGETAYSGVSSSYQARIDEIAGIRHQTQLLVTTAQLNADVDYSPVEVRQIIEAQVDAESYVKSHQSHKQSIEEQLANVRSHVSHANDYIEEAIQSSTDAEISEAKESIEYINDALFLAEAAHHKAQEYHNQAMQTGDHSSAAALEEIKRLVDTLRDKPGQIRQICLEKPLQESKQDHQLSNAAADATHAANLAGDDSPTIDHDADVEATFAAIQSGIDHALDPFDDELDEEHGSEYLDEFDNENSSEYGDELDDDYSFEDGYDSEFDDSYDGYDSEYDDDFADSYNDDTPTSLPDQSEAILQAERDLGTAIDTHLREPSHASLSEISQQASALSQLRQSSKPVVLASTKDSDNSYQTKKSVLAKLQGNTEKKITTLKTVLAQLDKRITELVTKNYNSEPIRDKIQAYQQQLNDLIDDSLANRGQSQNEQLAYHLTFDKKLQSIQDGTTKKNLDQEAKIPRGITKNWLIKPPTATKLAVQKTDASISRLLKSSKGTPKSFEPRATSQRSLKRSPTSRHTPNTPGRR